MATNIKSTKSVGIKSVIATKPKPINAKPVITKPVIAKPVITKPIIEEPKEEPIIEEPKEELVKPSSLTINDKVVYNADELYQYDKAFFYGCSRLRTVIDKKRLEADDYLFAYEKDGKWVLSVPDYRKSKLFLSEEWVHKNIPKMMGNKDDAKELYKYEEAPPILQLTDDEKFKDKDNNIIDIEVRGERNHKNCYFKVKDISQGFDMPNLQNVIGQNDTYEKYIDYKVFICSSNNRTINCTNKTLTFLTYEGMIKLLYISKNKNARYFRNWATEKLFTIQMGTKEAKEELSGSLIGVNAETIRNVFRTNTDKTPCIYLFSIGKASELLKGEYNPDEIVCKFGFTNDLPRRTDEHSLYFKKEFNTEIELLCWSIIDKTHLSEAETQVKEYFEDSLIQYKKATELIVITKKQLSQVRKYYALLQNKYIGTYAELYNQIKELEMKHKYELKEKDHIISLKDKDIEILQLKLELLTKYK